MCAHRLPSIPVFGSLFEIVDIVSETFDFAGEFANGGTDLREGMLVLIVIACRLAFPVFPFFVPLPLHPFGMLA